VFWKLSEKIHHRFEHPVIFTIFACGMSASNIVPPLYALANCAAGRLVSIIFAEYIVMLVLTVFYWTAYVRQRFEIAASADENRFTPELSNVIVLLALFIVLGSGLSVVAHHQYFSCSSAIGDIISGNAAVYMQENKARLAILQDESITDAVLEPYTKKAQMVAFDDITEDPEFWINVIVARYYGKNSVVLRGSN
jgi:hypothetical protein